MDEKFANYYIEILTKTVQDAIGKNIIFQAQNRIDTETIQELKSVIEHKDTENSNKDEGTQKLQTMIESLNGQVESFSRTIQELNRTVSEKDSNIEQLKLFIKDQQELQSIIDEKDFIIKNLEEKLKPKKYKRETIEIDKEQLLQTNQDTF